MLLGIALATAAVLTAVFAPLSVYLYRTKKLSGQADLNHPLFGLQSHPTIPGIEGRQKREYRGSETGIISRMTAELPRAITPHLSELSAALRVVIVNGPRQAGKTTLLHQLHRSQGGTFASLDERETRMGAHSDPTTFVAQGNRPLIIDEVQRGGDDLVLAIKHAVDTEPTPGQFILAGSTRFLTVPNLSESLAGRASIVEVWPFATAERFGGSVDFCDQLFADARLTLSDPTGSWKRSEYLELACTGGYPTAVSISGDRARRSWFSGYLTTIVARDISEFAQIRRAEVLPRLLGIVAARAGGLAVTADIARAVGMDEKTVRSYLTYLELVFLVGRLPGWATSLTTKLTRTPKLFLTDSGLHAHLAQATPSAFNSPSHPALGGLVETFVFTELTRLRSLSETSFTLSHFRDREGHEVDFILETPDGRVVAIEVKASASPSAKDARNLHWLRDKLGDRCVAAVLLHLGNQATSLGNGVLALPVSQLWRGAKV